MTSHPMNQETTMSSARDVNVPRDETILIEASDIPLFCPGPKAPLWSMHPRVYIEIARDGKAICPYCSARYALRPGEVIRGH